MDNEKQFRLLSLILLGLSGLVFIRQISAAPTSSIGFGGKVAPTTSIASIAAVDGKASSAIDDIMRPTELEVDSVVEVENINAGKTLSFTAGLNASPTSENPVQSAEDNSSLLAK